MCTLISCAIWSIFQVKNFFVAVAIVGLNSLKNFNKLKQINFSMSYREQLIKIQRNFNP